VVEADDHTSVSGLIAAKSKNESINSHICHTRSGISAGDNNSSTTSKRRKKEFARIGATKLINQASFTLGSSLCSQVIGCSSTAPGVAIAVNPSSILDFDFGFGLLGYL